MKLFSFEHNEGTEVIIANNAKEAVIHYFTKYQDDIIIDDILSATEEGMKISEIQGTTLTEQRRIFDEEINEHVVASYQEIIDGYTGMVPDVLYAPNY